MVGAQFDRALGLSRLVCCVSSYLHPGFVFCLAMLGPPFERPRAHQCLIDTLWAIGILFWKTIRGLFACYLAMIGIQYMRKHEQEAIKSSPAPRAGSVGRSPDANAALISLPLFLVDFGWGGI